MKLDIVIVHVPRYRRGHEIDFVPPLTGIHLAAITPRRHDVRVIHQQVDPVDLETDADLVALSFDLMEASGCIGIFLGIESLNSGSLAEANKRQNRIGTYADAIEKLHERGICVMAGFIAGFDHDTPESIVTMADQLYEIGVDVPFLSILTPYKGTALHARMEQENRLLDRSWSFYNGYNVAFRPTRMSDDALLDAHRALWQRAFSPAYSLRRVLRASRRLRAGALMMATAMNGFYGWKRLTGNRPLDESATDRPFEKSSEGRSATDPASRIRPKTRPASDSARPCRPPVRFDAERLSERF